MLLTQVSSEDGTLDITNDIFESLKAPFVVEDHDIFITAGIGISLFPDDGEIRTRFWKTPASRCRRAKEA